MVRPGIQVSMKILSLLYTEQSSLSEGTVNFYNPVTNIDTDVSKFVIKDAAEISSRELELVLVHIARTRFDFWKYH